MMREEIAQFEEITGETGWNTPIGEIGRFLDGYERGCDKTIDRVLEIIDEEIEESKNDSDNRHLIRVRLYNVQGAVMDLKGGDEE